MKLIMNENGTKSLLKDDGSKFKLNGKTEFKYIVDVLDGTYICLTGECFKSSMIKDDGTAFEYNGKNDFMEIIMNENGFYKIQIDHRSWILLEKDGTIFSFNGQKEFIKITRYEDGCTRIVASEFGDNQEQLIKPDGTAFEIDGKTMFENIQKDRDDPSGMMYKVHHVKVYRFNV